MKKVAVLFHDGFEVLEALSVVDVMTRANVTCTMVGMDKLEVESSHHIKVVMDCLCDENIETYDALVIPGGLPGATNLRDDKRVIDLVQKFNNANKIVAAICAGPIVLLNIRSPREHPKYKLQDRIIWSIWWSAV